MTDQNNSSEQMREAVTAEDREIVLGLIAWLQGAAQGDRPNTTRGEAAEALQRLLSAPAQAAYINELEKADAALLGDHIKLMAENLRLQMSVDALTLQDAREKIETAWLCGYWHTEYTHDSAYANEQAKRCADELLQGAAQAPQPAQDDTTDEYDIDNPMPLHPITWEQVKPYATDWLMTEEDGYSGDERQVLNFVRGLLADFAPITAAPKPAQEIFTYALRSGHGTHYRDSIADLAPEVRAMWRALYAAPVPAISPDTLSLLKEARDTIDALPGYPRGAGLCDRIDAMLAAAPQSTVPQDAKTKRMLDQDAALRIAQHAHYLATPSEFPSVEIMLAPHDLVRFFEIACKDYAPQDAKDAEKWREFCAAIKKAADAPNGYADLYGGVNNLQVNTQWQSKGESGMRLELTWVAENEVRDDLSAIAQSGNAGKVCNHE